MDNLKFQNPKQIRKKSGQFPLGPFLEQLAMSSLYKHQTTLNACCEMLQFCKLQLLLSLEPVYHRYFPTVSVEVV